MSKIVSAFTLCLLLAATQACVPKQTYETHVSELNETVAQREKEIAELRGYKTKYEQANAELELLKGQKDVMDQLSKDIKEALDALKKEGEVEYNPVTKSWTMSTDFLFRSGSWEVSPEGQKLIKKFVAAFKGKDTKFMIVGHTDTDPIQHVADKVKSKMNLELGMFRAFKVAEIMHREGVKETNMWIESRGMSDPVKVETKGDFKKKCRRVEIYVLGNGENTPPTSGSK